MFKKVGKELVIIILLLAAILLILTVLFYDSIPINKVVPSTVTYTLPETLKDELDKPIEDEQQVIVTYKIDQESLTQYEKNDSYNPGKVDPFASYQGQSSTPSTDVTGSEKSTGGNTSTTGNGGSQGTSNTGTTSGTSTGASTTKTPVVNK